MKKHIYTLIFACTAAGIASAQEPADTAAFEGELQEVQVVRKRDGRSKSHLNVENRETISATELCRAACCNLGESFVTNPSVDVSYTDAATGAKQIKLLGLSGSYVQMLTENIPAYRGAAAPFSLGYVPGPWMQSIQVSKGIASVKNGYEAITGQINVEFLKPQSERQANANIFFDSHLKGEINLDGNIHLGDEWSTGLLLHYEKGFRNHDDNKDGFLDIPKIEQLHFTNRWTRMSPNHTFQFLASGLFEDRQSGQAHNAHINDECPLYTIGIKTKRADAFMKNAYIFDPEHVRNIALILSGSFHQQHATYGDKFYGVNQWNGYASLMYEGEFDGRNSLSTGLSLNYDDYADQRFQYKGVNQSIDTYNREAVAGAYAQYTYNLDSKLIIMAGIRADYSSIYKWFVTPRAHVKYSPLKWISLRVSAGKGYRTNHILAEYNYLLASSRQIHIDPDLKQEEAWNYGFSATFTPQILGKKLDVSAEYYYTRFGSQLVADLDIDPHGVWFGNLDGKSYSHTFQIEASYPVFSGFSMTAAYRYNDVRCTYSDGITRERPLTSKSKFLITATYKTPLELWQFDATFQYLGGGRMPTPYTLPDGTPSWNDRFKGFCQLSAQVTRWFRWGSVYVGGENLTGFKQKNPIVGADNPWGPNFDATMIWGPLSGAMVYAGVRITLK